MNFKNQIILISFLIGLSLVSSKYIPFQFTLQCTDANNQCDFNNGANWLGGVPPGNGDVAGIDYSNATTDGSITIFSNANVKLDGLVVLGKTNFKVQIIIGQKSSLEANQDISISYGSLTQSAGTKVLSSNFEFIDSDYANNGGDLEVTVKLTFDNTSLFQASQSASVSLSGDNVFNIQPYIKDTSVFAAVGTTTFNQGFKAEGNTFIGSAVLYQESTANSISVTHNLTLDGGAKLHVLNINGTTASSVQVNSLAFLEVNGATDSGNAYFNNLITQVNSATNITTSTLTIVQFRSAGTVCLDTIANVNVANGNFADLFLAGKVSIQANNTKIRNMGTAVSTHGSTTSQFFLSFVGNGNTICNTTSDGMTGLSLTVMNDGKLWMNQQSCNFKADQTSTLDILGQFTALGADIRVEVTTHSNDAYLVLNNTFVYNDVNMQGGILDAANLTIINDLWVTNSGVIDMDFNGDTLYVGGDIHWENTTLVLNQYFNNEGPAPIYSDGIIYIQGDGTTLLMNFYVDIVNSLRYNVLQANSNITGQFKTVTVLAQDKNLADSESYHAYIDNVPNTYYLLFSSADGARSHKLAGWKIFLIILSVFVVLGGIVGAFFYLRRTKGYMRLN
eukprot:gene4032-5047_t